MVRISVQPNLLLTDLHMIIQSHTKALTVERLMFGCVNSIVASYGIYAVFFRSVNIFPKRKKETPLRS
jgi:hypothetical protein